MPAKKDKIYHRMMKDFKLSSDAEADNRTRALFVQDFIRPGADQWDTNQLKARGKRASYSFNQLPKFGRQVINDMWQNMPQIKFIPKGDTNKDKAEVLEDKIREVQATGSAQTAYKLAIKSQINIGWAYFAFGTEYESNESRNQNIVILEKPNTFQIYDDPATRKQDRSDRRFLIEVEDVPRTEFNRDNDKDYSNNELSSIGDDYPDWASVGKDIVRVGHYWRVEITKTKRWFEKDSDEYTDDKPSDEDKYEMREIEKKKVMYYKCTPLEELEKCEWLGSHIPFCFVEGNKDIVDGKVYYTGLYEDMISTQILYNYSTNTAIELAESAPISPFMGDHRAFKGFEEFYDNANTKNYSRLPYNALDDAGQPINAPVRTQNGVDLGSAVQLIQMAEQNFYGTSGIYPASLGQQSNEKSGKAIIARQKEGDVSTSNYPDAFARALLYGGEIFKDLSKKVLDGARTIQVMSEDKKVRDIKINQKYTDKVTGKPMHYDLTEGDYEIMTSTGASYSTKREEAREAQIQLFQAAPGPMLPALPNIIRNMDYPGADKDADAVERGLPPQLRDPEHQAQQMKGMPPAAQAQLQQAGQMIQQLGQQLQEAQAAANDKTAENQAKLGDLQVKAQNAQNQQQKDAAESAYKMAQIQFDREKLATETALEQENQRIEWAKLQIEAASNGEQVAPMPAPEPEPQQPTFPANLGPNALQGHMMDAQEKTNMDNQANQLKVAELTQQEQNAQMLMQMLHGITQSIAALNVAVSTPKTAVKIASGDWVVAPVGTA